MRPPPIDQHCPTGDDASLDALLAAAEAGDAAALQAFYDACARDFDAVSRALATRALDALVASADRHLDVTAAHAGARLLAAALGPGVNAEAAIIRARIAEIIEDEERASMRPQRAEYPSQGLIDQLVGGLLAGLTPAVRVAARAGALARCDDRAVEQRLLAFMDSHYRVPAGGMIRLGPLWNCPRCRRTLLSTAPACAGCGEAAAHLPRLSCGCSKPLFSFITGTLYDEHNYAEGDVGAAECATCGRIVPVPVGTHGL